MTARKRSTRLPARLRRKQTVVLRLERLEDRLLLDAGFDRSDAYTLLSDAGRVGEDWTTARIAFVNVALASQANAPPPAAAMSQFATAWSILAADGNQMRQDFVHFELAALGTWRQELDTLVQDADTLLLEDLGIRLMGRSEFASTSAGNSSASDSAKSPQHPGIGVSPAPATDPPGMKLHPLVSPPPLPPPPPPPPPLSPIATLSLAEYTVNENAGTEYVTVHLNAPSTQNVSVFVNTSDGTATAPIDYMSQSVGIIFAPGQTSKTVGLGILDDGSSDDALANQYFNVYLSNPTNCTLGTPSTAPVYIVEADNLPLASVATPSCNCGAPGEQGSLLKAGPMQPNTAAVQNLPFNPAANTATVQNLPYDPNSGPPQETPYPVRYADGVATVAATDLHSDGFGFPWGQTRTWTSGAGYAQGSDNGSGWVDTYIPHLIQADGVSNNTLIFLANGDTAYYYDLINGVYQPRLNDGSKLTYSSSNDTFTLIDTQGDEIVLDGFGSSWLTAQRGQFASFTSPGGEKMAVTSYTSDGHVAEMQRSETSNGNTTIESWLYSYLPTGNANAGLLSGVTLRTQVNGGAWTTVRQVQYTYYDGTQTYGGSVGDLMTATVEDGNNNVLDTSYYRYYKSGDANGYAHGLKYVFNPDSYDRLTAALGTNLSSLTDAQVAPYADNYIQYDSSQRVTQETAAGAGDSQTAGGQGTYTFSYTASGSTPGYNTWNTKTVVANPDGSTETVYTNYAGEVMLDDHYDPASNLHSDSFYAYNSDGELALVGAPSAVSGYNSTNPDLLNDQNGSYQYLNNSSGLITRFDYYSTTTAGETTAGGVANYLQDEKIQQGQQGTLIPQETWQYYAHAYNGQTIAPIASDTVYRNTDGTGAEATSSSYTWFANTAQIASETDSAPVISASENGPGTADVTTSYFDPFGNAQWIKDPDGYIEYDNYDPVTGALLTQIVDVNTADTGEFTNLPSGWSTPSGGGLNLVTTDQVDALGRTTEETSPAGNVTYYVYLDPQHEERIYQGWNSTTGTPTGPTAVIRHDPSDSYDEVFTMSATPHLTNGVPDGTEAISGLQTLSRAYTNDAGQLVSENDYFNLGGLSYSTGAMGSVNVNYYQTNYGYDSDGRLVRTQTPNGTIYRMVYNSLGESVSDWVGTNDTPASGEWSPSNNNGTANMVEVSSYQYDNGGIGDGNLTQETDYPGLSAANRVTDSWYDWRDRLVAQKSGVESSENDGVNRPIIVNTYDNLDEVTETQQYVGDGVTPTISGGVLQALPAGDLRAQEINNYDDQGRLYQTQVYDVNPSTVAVSASALTTNYYYDHRGDSMAESDPGGLWTKSQYDGAGRDVMDYTTDGADGTTWAEAGSVANDTVLEQEQTVYDADSNPIETIDSQRFHNATGTGPLGNPSSGIGARVYYAAAYYDNADRLIADVDAGTNGGTAWARPNTIPSSSATLLATNYVYNASGWLQDTIDPMGIDTRTNYDNLGRVTQTIQDYTNGTETAESNISTEYGYDGNDNVIYVQADEPSGSYQKTAYVYGVTTAAGDGVNSNDILSAVQHPDPSTGNPSSSQQDSYLVNALGQVVQATDRNGNVHQYSYDVLGRQTSDAVTTLGAGVDGTVRQITYGYDSQGNLSLITSYNAASGGSIVNQVQRVFNGLGQLTGEYQSQSGAVNTSSTPEVQYAYTEMSSGQNNSRLTSMAYPSGYVLNYNYNAGLDSNISRLSSISDSSNTLESYKYLGLDTVVERDHPQNNVNLSYIKQSGDTQANSDGGGQYTGLDRFGRVIDQNWVNGTTGTSTDRFQYGYDQDSDVLYRQNLVDAAMSELYTYDNLNQLTSFQRGTLNSTKSGLTGSASRSQSWSPDALGNFTGVTTNGTTQTRTANQQNEYTSISGSGTITYDANGNITADGSGNTYVYDAWNRLVAVKNGTTTLAAYGYDGLGRRITETHGSTTTDLYYSANWQVLEEHDNGQLQARYVWSPSGIDTLVLRDDSSQNNGVLDRRLYVQQDANGNVTALIDTNGNVVERYDYDPFGVVTVLNPDFSVRGTSSYSWNYFFQGMRYDGTVGSYDSRARVYSPTLMRPLQADPLGLGPDINYYRWEGNGPTDTIDPSGMQPPYGGMSGGMGGMGMGGMGMGGMGMGGGMSGYRPPYAPGGGLGPYGGQGGGGGSYTLPSPTTPTRGGYGGYGGPAYPGADYRPPLDTRPFNPIVNTTLEEVLEEIFYYPIESTRIAGDILRLATAGIWNLFGGDPYMPDLHSDAGKCVPPASDREASAQWMKDHQNWNLQNGTAAVIGKATSELLPGGRVQRKSCFPAGTLVATSEGLRPIETIIVGNLVWAYDLVASRWRLCRVKEPYSLHYKGTLVYTTVAAETIVSTYRHPYWVVRGEDLASRPWLEHLAFVPKEATTPGRWVDSCDLRVGDEVLLRDGRVVQVERVEFGPFQGTVYNMEVEELQCYTVGQNSALVHNNNGPATGPAGAGVPIPPLTQAQRRAIQKIDNIIRDHLKPGPRGDIAGTVSDMVGNPIRKPGGGFWDHVGEMNDTIRGLRNHIKALEGVADAAAVQARQRAIDALQAIEDATQGAGL